MPTRRFNIVAFRIADLPEDPENPWANKVRIQLDAPWLRSAGTKPDVNVATVPFQEFAKLLQQPVAGTVGDETVPAALRPRTNGDMLFYFTSETVPDVIEPDITMVDARATLQASQAVAGDEHPIDLCVIYRIMFADWRLRYQPPRGGVLIDGELNGGESATAADLDNKTLIAKCLTTMGLPADVPDTVNEVPALRNIKWLGARPMVELQKLLDHTGHAFIPRQDRTKLIQKITTGDDPAIPRDREMPALALDDLDRRSRIVVVTSAPTPVIHAFNGNAVTLPWIYVAQDHDGRWTKLEDIPELIQGADGEARTPLETLNLDFPDTPEPYLRTIEDQIFRVLAPDPAKYPKQCRVLRKHFKRDEDDGLTFTVEDVKITATILLERKDGRASNASQPVPIPVAWLGDGNILACQNHLLKLDSSGLFEDVVGHLLNVTDLRTEFSIEGWDSTYNFKEYLILGFRSTVQTDGTEEITQVEPAEARAIALSSADPDAIVLNMPELRYIRRNPLDVPAGAPDDLLDALTSLAKAKATVMLRGSGTPVRHRYAMGFLAGELSGKVQRILYDQRSLNTTFEVNTWYIPAARIRGHQGDGLLAYPGQNQEGESKMFLGASGGSQPAVPIMPALLPSSSPASVFPVYISAGLGIGEGYTVYGGRPKTGTIETNSGTFTMGQLYDIDTATVYTAFNSQFGDSSSTHSLTAEPVRSRWALARLLELKDASQGNRRCCHIIALDVEPECITPPS